MSDQPRAMACREDGLRRAPVVCDMKFEMPVIVPASVTEEQPRLVDYG